MGQAFPEIFVVEDRPPGAFAAGVLASGLESRGVCGHENQCVPVPSLSAAAPLDRLPGLHHCLRTRTAARVVRRRGREDDQSRRAAILYVGWILGRGMHAREAGAVPLLLPQKCKNPLVGLFIGYVPGAVGRKLVERRPR